MGFRRSFWASLLTASGFLLSGFVASHFPVEFRAEATLLRTYTDSDQQILLTTPGSITDDLLRPEFLPRPSDAKSCSLDDAVRLLRRRLTVRREGVQPNSDRIVIGLSHRRPEAARRELDLLVRAYTNRFEASPERQRIAQRLHEAERGLRLADRACNTEHERLARMARQPQSPMARGAVHRVYKKEDSKNETQLHAQLERGRRRRAELVELYTAQHPAVAELDKELAVLARQCELSSVAAGTLQNQADRAMSEQREALEQCALREQSIREVSARQTHERAARDVKVLSASLQRIDHSRTIRCWLSDEPPAPAQACGLWRRRAAFFLGCAASCAFGASLLTKRAPL